MADPKGFLSTPRETPVRRPVDLRLLDWREVYEPFPPGRLERQAGRCMDCGIPFCHNGCPLGNLIPEWNDLVWRHDWRDAADRLHATNNFPEFTGRLCPAPCEAACVLGINADPVTIKQVEVEIIDRAFASGLGGADAPGGADRADGRGDRLRPGRAGRRPAAHQGRARGDRLRARRRGRRPAPLRHPRVQAGEAAPGPAARPDARRGHRVPLRRRGGHRRLRGERCGLPSTPLVLAGGARVARDLPMPGRELDGIYQAMEYLPLSNRAVAADPGAPADPAISARGRHVVIIGGGDTGADCLGTAHRQGAASVTQLEILPRPPAARPEHQPWPTYPMIYRVSSAHEEGGERTYAVTTLEFLGDAGGRVRALRLADAAGFDPVPGTEHELPCDLVLLAMGFTGAERPGLLAGLGVDFDQRGNVARDGSYATSVPGVFVAGDMGRGQSLIVWAIAEGRSAAAAVDRYLGGVSELPAPIPPTARPLI